MATGKSDKEMIKKFKPKQHKLPNGLKVWNSKASGGDLGFIYRELWEGDSNFAEHGLSIKDGDTVFDVGANVGMFSLFMADHLGKKNLNIYAFEPAPPTNFFCSLNFRDHLEKDNNIKLFPFGIFSEEKELEITYYDRATGNSTLYPDTKGTELSKERCDQVLSNLKKMPGAQTKVAWAFLHMLYPFRRALIRKGEKVIFGKAQKFTCLLKTISQMIDQENVKHIHLLKIDIEGSEVEALKGIREEHWEIIDQVVMELETNKETAIEILESHGFEVNLEQESMQRGTAIDNVFARKKHLSKNMQ